MNEEIMLFGAAWCNDCKTAKKMLDEKGLAYTYIDVDTPAGRAMAEDYKARGLPLGILNGYPIFNNSAGLKRYLANEEFLKKRAAREEREEQEVPEEDGNHERVVRGIADLLAREAKPLRRMADLRYDPELNGQIRDARNMMFVDDLFEEVPLNGV